MIGLGIGECIGGIVNGQLQDRLGTRVALFLNVLQMAAAYICLIIYTF